MRATTPKRSPIRTNHIITEDLAPCTPPACRSWNIRPCLATQVLMRSWNPSSAVVADSIFPATCVIVSTAWRASSLAAVDRSLTSPANWYTERARNAIRSMDLASSSVVAEVSPTLRAWLSAPRAMASISSPSAGALAAIRSLNLAASEMIRSSARLNELL